MILIKKDITYTKRNYHYKNFISLSDEEKLMVLDWRNHESIRKWMYNQNEIEKESHFAFIQSLAEREDCFYWLVFNDEKPVGVFSITDINYQTSQVSSGFYIDPYHEKEEIFDFIITFDRLMFENFNVEKLYGGMLSSNMYPLLISIYMGTVIEIEKYISGQKFLYGTLTRENYFKNIEKKENIKEFARFVRNYKCKLNKINNPE
jgi:UDP-4-amino-4,6-dideoxy-N-acetyl-beta-L-altrosamine N-acetyltransferase